MQSVTLVVNAENGLYVENLIQWSDSYYIHKSKFYVFIFDDIDNQNLEEIKSSVSWFNDYEYQLKIFVNNSNEQIDDESMFDEITELGSHLFDLKHGKIL